MGIPAGPKNWQDHTNPFIAMTECLVSYVREEGICLAYSLRGFSPPWQGRPDCCRRRKLEVAARTASAQAGSGEMRWMWTFMLSFLFLFRSGPPHMGWCCPHSGYVLPPQVSFPRSVFTDIPRRFCHPHRLSTSTKIPGPEALTS